MVKGLSWGPEVMSPGGPRGYKAEKLLVVGILGMFQPLAKFL